MSNDVTQQLKDTENSLRDFIATMLESIFGKEWLLKCGVTQNRITTWQERKLTEEKKLSASTADERLIYYADFYDLKTILKKNWEVFKVIFGNQKKFEVYLNIIEDFRNPEAHRREIFPHEKELLSGIAGEIRNMIIRYRSKKESSEDYFPKIECVRENLGRVWTPQSRTMDIKTVRVDDIIELIVTATDPEDGKIKYGIFKSGKTDWQEKGNLKLIITKKDVSKNFSLHVAIKSDRDYHALNDPHDPHDDRVTFQYIVLPKK